MGEPATRPRRLYPRIPSALVVGAALILLAGVLLFLLVTGGGDAPAETRGDLTYLEGTALGRAPGKPQLAASIADLISADVVAGEAGTLIFTAEVAAPVPETLKRAALEFRWQLEGEDGAMWTLTVSVDTDSRVALFSDGGYGSGTVDDTLPGQLTMADRKVEVRLDVTQIDEFPSTFEWNLATTLRAFRGEPDSPRVADWFPDDGAVGF